MVALGPIALQYAAEITHPTPEGTSNSLMQLFGQASVVFVYVMAACKSPDGSFTPSLLLSALLLVVSAVVVLRMHGPVVRETVQPAPTLPG